MVYHPVALATKLHQQHIHVMYWYARKTRKKENSKKERKIKIWKYVLYVCFLYKADKLLSIIVLLVRFKADKP